VFKFTIREAILMTTIVAVLLMWWMERSQNAKYEARLTALETKLQTFPVVPVFQATRSVANGPIPTGASVPAPPTMPQSTTRWTGIPKGAAPVQPANYKNVVIPAEAQPTIIPAAPPVVR
jgi:hypothetical protein